MKVRRLLCLLALTVAPSGCTWIPYAVENLVEAPCDMVDRWCLCWRFHRQANDAWAQIEKADPTHAYSPHYVRGFKEGFVDFLESDGTGEPPAAPPWAFRKSQYMTPEGRQEVEDWFAGFRHGTAAARASGLRETIAVPLALPPIHAPLGFSDRPQPSAVPSEAPAEAPMPRVLPTSDVNTGLDTLPPAQRLGDNEPAQHPGGN
jgi:hypothetical protein